MVDGGIAMRAVRDVVVGARVKTGTRVKIGRHIIDIVGFR
jgi:hypothetical protein